MLQGAGKGDSAANHGLKSCLCAWIENKNESLLGNDSVCGLFLKHECLAHEPSFSTYRTCFGQQTNPARATKMMGWIANTNGNG
ncbi:hypothetical protein VNO77_21374 [Canavalia gladiata]|uniref:Uncharacterized protein n=1 Tax=Canavalia gladiata TaxID=3824 RepID=A0AAN9LQY4_CANGL